ncbi:MAG: OadG family transporter subunit [Waltera sp.]
MKKFLSLVCMITCIFGLTACGSEETYTDYEQRKMDTAIQIATQYVIPSLENFEDEAALESFSEYTADEVAYMVQENVGITVDGYAYKTAIESFNSAKKSIGGITAVGDAEATIDDDQIIVHVDVTGAKQNAQAEVIFTNDMFLSMESAALNPVESMGGLMTKAALNTLIGMGTVFVMLIMISLIISLFNLKIQAAFSKKDKEEEAKNAGIDKAVTQIVAQEEPEADDTELVAVIAAAIAASEGAASTDGFVVRSIRKVR